MNKNRKGGPGRGHWSKSMSVLVAGGAMRVGQAVGSTDGRGEQPQERSWRDLGGLVWHGLPIRAMIMVHAIHLPWYDFV
jgi:hypothetical protein